MIKSLVPRRIKLTTSDIRCDVYISKELKNKLGTSKWYDSSIRQGREKYREWLNENTKLKSELYELVGQTLGCFCDETSENCHGSILVEEVETYLKNKLNDDADKDVEHPEHVDGVECVSINIVPVKIERPKRTGGYLRIKKLLSESNESETRESRQCKRCENENEDEDDFYRPLKISKIDPPKVTKRWLDMSEEERIISRIDDCLTYSGYDLVKYYIEKGILNGHFTRLMSGHNVSWDPVVCVVTKRVYKKSIDKYMLEVNDGESNHKLLLTTQASDMVKYKIIEKDDKVLVSYYACTRIKAGQYLISVTGLYPLKDNIDVKTIVKNEMSSTSKSLSSTTNASS